MRPTKDKRIKPALTNKIRKKKRSVVVVAESTSYRSYTAFQLYSAIMYFTSIECQRSKKKLEQKFPNVPYRTVLDYVNKPEKMKNIDLLTNIDLKWRETEVTESVRTNVVLLCTSFGNTSDAALDDVDSRVHPRLSD